MATLRIVAAAAALSLVHHVHAWTIPLPPCLEPFQPFVYAGCYSDLSSPDTLTYRSTLPREDMTIEKCIADCKGNGYRYAGLEYYGECYCGATVNGPMVEESQCSFACTGNSSQVCGGNDRISIYQDPTFLPHDPEYDVEDYQNIGCHTDDSSLGKTLGYPVQDVTGQPWDRETGTNDKCLAACKAKGFPFAGTEYGGECYCGVVMGNGTLAVDVSECNMPCLGDASQNCGGPGRINIFVARELLSLEPCGYHPPSSSTSTSSTAPPSTSTTSSSSSSTSSTEPPSSTTSTSSSSSSSTQTPSTTTSPSSTTTCPPTTTTPPTTTKPPTSSTTTSSAICVTTTVIPPKCEYGCGHWCSDELPDWEDEGGCKNSHSNCKMQIAACFKNAGWPGSMDCFSFSKWCVDVDDFCKSSPKNKCSKKTFCGQKPPKPGPGKPTTSTITIPCKPTTTSKPATTKPVTTTSKPATSTTTKCPVPTVTNICKQPTDKNLGYGPGNPVGGIELPIVTCNDLKKDFDSGNQWKLYTESDSAKCKSYPHWNLPNACKDACKEQYDDCTAVYAQGCKKNSGGYNYGWPWKRSIAGRTVWTDTWESASSKCTAQYKDCIEENKNAAANGKCWSWGNGWY